MVWYPEDARWWHPWPVLDASVQTRYVNVDFPRYTEG